MSPRLTALRRGAYQHPPKSAILLLASDRIFLRLDEPDGDGTALVRPALLLAPAPGVRALASARAELDVASEAGSGAALSWHGSSSYSPVKRRPGGCARAQGYGVPQFVVSDPLDQK